MKESSKSVPKAGGAGATTLRLGFGVTLFLLCAVLVILFYRSFSPSLTLFANDGPLGVISSAAGSLPEGFTGVWLDLNWLGGRGITASPTVTMILAWICGPVLFSKLHAAFALFLLGLGTWLFFRQLKLGALACTAGAIASMLNTSALSIAAWGLPPWTIARAMVFLALAALVTQNRGNRWINSALAGLAVGMNVAEGFDVGAICSLLVAAFVLFQSLSAAEPGPKKAAIGAGRLALVTICAGLMAAQTVSSLVSTQVQGIAGAQQDERTREKQWDWATQWSLPKIELIRVIIPGLFGYRMDTPGGGNYWGTVGRQPGWEQHHQGFARHSGAGEYAGVLVVLVALWAAAQGFARKETFPPEQRKFILFWSGVALVGVLMAFGRHAPFYQIIFSLPYFSTVRNPVKWMILFQIAVLILFGYGVDALTRCYLSQARESSLRFRANLKQWWSSASVFERRWTQFLIGLLGASVLGGLIYFSSQTELQRYLANQGFGPEESRAIAAFSLREIGWFILFLALSVCLLIAISSGWFTGKRTKLGAWLLILLVAIDLLRANQPWIIYYNYREKYASNPVIDILRERPYEQRVTVLPFDSKDMPALGMLQQVYHVFWAQHHFPYYNIQSLDMTQESRQAEDKLAFQTTVGRNILRYWELTGTRYIFGLAGLVEPLNQQLDPQLKRFQPHTLFALGQERADSPILVQTNTTGPFALIEFTGALPRAVFYPQWQVETNHQAVLERLASPEFNPRELVIVDREVPSGAAGRTNAPGEAKVGITRYSPKAIDLKAEVPAAGILLLNDRFDPDWHVRVDGNEEPLLRCDFIMRGVYLPAGSHTVEFRYKPPITSLWVSAGALVIGLVLLGIVAIPTRKPGQQDD